MNKGVIRVICFEKPHKRWIISFSAGEIKVRFVAPKLHPQIYKKLINTVLFSELPRLPGFSGYAYYWRKKGSVFCSCMGKQSVRLSAKRIKAGRSPHPLLYQPRRYLFGKQKTKSNDISSSYGRRKERDSCQGKAGADDLD